MNSQNAWSVNDFLNCHQSKAKFMQEEEKKEMQMAERSSSTPDSFP
jgi:hypothetical protein